MNRRDALLLGSIWGSKKVPKCCPNENVEIVTEDTESIDFEGSGTVDNPLQANIIISETAGNQVIINPDGIFVPIASPTPQYHGNTALVSKSGTDATAATAFTTLSPSGRAWNWNLPFLTISAANTAGVEPHTIVIENGTYVTTTITKSTTIEANPGVTIPNITCTTTNKILNIIGKPNLLSSNDNPALFTDNGVTGTFELGKVTGDSGIFTRGRTGQTSYLSADSVDITQDNGFLNGAIHNGANTHGATLYATVPYISMNYIGDPSFLPDAVGVETRGVNATTYIRSHVIRANTSNLASTYATFHGTLDATFSGKLHVIADYVENFGLGRAFAVGPNSFLYLNCSEIRVASSTIEAGSFNSGGTIYFKSGCRVVAGASATYAITGTGTLFIDGTVYSNKPLDPAITLSTGTWVVDVGIV